MGFDEYTKAKKLGEKAYRRDVAAGRYPFLPALDEMIGQTHSLPEQRLGLREIPISLIKGTVTRGRQGAFATNFMPLLPEDSEFARKWTSLLKYQQDEGIADPVKVYEFLGRFYVEEGNKRVSVMRFLGNNDIPAEVIRILPPDLDSDEIRVYRQFLRFYKCTGQYEPMMSEEDSYERLARIYGRSLEEEWDWRTVQSLKAAFFRFSREYRAQGGEKLALSAGDAFLLFLDIFGRQPLYGGMEDDLKKKIRQVWAEYRVRSNRIPNAFLRKPNIRQPRSPLKRILNKAAGHSVSGTLRIAFIYDGDPAQSRWLNGHEQGRLALEKRMRGRVRSVAFPGCSSSDAFDEAVKKAIEAGAGIIFTTSPTQMGDALRAAVAHPDVRFLNCSVNLSHRAVRTYYGRMYEVKFLLGALAAALAEEHEIGYVCGVPLYGTIANINAFAIGASMVDPRVRIHLIWSCLEGGDWRRDLRERGLTIVSGPDLIRPGREDREYGLYRYEEDGSIGKLATPIWDWGLFYELMIRTAMSGTWDQEEDAIRDQALSYWWGLSSGVIGLDMSDLVPASSRHLIDGLRKAMMAGILGPFEGSMFSQTGMVEAGSQHFQEGTAEAGSMPSQARTVEAGSISYQAGTVEAGSMPYQAGTVEAGSRTPDVRRGEHKGRKLLRVLPLKGGKLLVRSAEEETEPDVGLSPEEIITMDWLHEKVIGRIPPLDEMTETARRAVLAGGIQVSGSRGKA